jgi:cyclase
MALDGEVPRWTDYRNGRQESLSEAVVDAFESGIVSEALVIDWQHEGFPAAFDTRLLATFPARSVPLIAFGGLSEPDQLRTVLQLPRVGAVAVGNFLNYREHAITHCKSQLAGLPVRSGGADSQP